MKAKGKTVKVAVVSKTGKVSKKQLERDMRALGSMARFMAKNTATRGKKPKGAK